MTRKTSELARLLAAQRESETRALVGLCGLHLDAGAIRGVGERLEGAAAAESGSLLRVEEPPRLPTEAIVIRHNPKLARVVPVRDADRPPSIRRLLGALSTGWR
ncbi:hypothetical protein EPN29_10725 [bacterium]|nr:MAG: hypothetical protein EPN29_10725 [bacterium]